MFLECLLGCCVCLCVTCRFLCVCVCCGCVSRAYLHLRTSLYLFVSFARVLLVCCVRVVLLCVSVSVANQIYANPTATTVPRSQAHTNLLVTETENHTQPCTHTYQIRCVHTNTHTHTFYASVRATAATGSRDRRPFTHRVLTWDKLSVYTQTIVRRIQQRPQQTHTIHNIHTHSLQRNCRWHVVTRGVFTSTQSLTHIPTQNTRGKQKHSLH